jgi:exoribonuclease II
MDPRNPYIEEFLRTLIKRKEKKLEPDALERLVESLNRLFENMLGRNMIAALPEDIRRDFVSRYDKGSRDVDVSRMSIVFDQYIDDPARIMKSTLKEFADLYFQNR